MNRLKSVGLLLSMPAPRQPTQNAQAENFFQTLKCEEVYVHRYQTFEETQEHLQISLGEVSNAKHLRSSLGYVPPDESEVNYLKRSYMGGMDFSGSLQPIAGSALANRH